MKLPSRVNNLKHRKKGEKGSVTLFVLIAMLFFLMIGMMIFIINMNTETSQKKDVEKIQSEYNKDVEDTNLEQLYQEAKQKQQGLFIIKLIDQLDNIYNSGEWINKNWLTTENGNRLPLKIEPNFPAGLTNIDVTITDDIKGGSVQIKDTDSLKRMEIGTADEGIYTITNNIDTTNQVTVKIDLTDPVVNSIAGCETWIVPDGTNENYATTITANDPAGANGKAGSGIAQISYVISTTVPGEGVTWENVEGTKITVEGASAPVTIDSSIGEGDYYIYAKTIDVAGNNSEMATSGVIKVRTANYKITTGAGTPTYSETLADAIYRANQASTTTESTIQALRNTNDDSVATVNKTITLDLNGKTLTVTKTITNNATLDIYSSVDGGTITGSPDTLISNRGTLTTNGTSAEHTMSLINTTTKDKTRVIASTSADTNVVTINANSTLEFTNPISNGDDNRYIITNSGIVTVNGATLRTSTEGTEREHGISNTSTSPNGRIIINDGTTIETTGYALRNNGGTGTGDTPAILVNGDNTVISGKPGIYNYPNGTINVTGGTISGETYGIFNELTGTINVSGGTITGPYGIYNNANGTINVSGDNTYIEGTTEWGIRVYLGNATVTGGTIKGVTRGITVSSNNDYTGTLTLGTNDSSVSKTSPVIISDSTEEDTYGVNVVNNAVFNFYDGKIVARDGATINGNVSALPTSYQVVKTTTDGRETAVLEKEVTVTFNPNPTGTTGGTVAESSRKVLTNLEYQYDAENKTNRTLPTPVKAGYTFQGWKINGEGEYITDTALVAREDNHTLTAVWELNIYNITYNLDGGTNNSNNPSTYTVESPNITLQDATKEGYIFRGWTGNGTNTPTKNLVLPHGSTGDKTYTANWAQIHYNVTYGSPATTLPAETLQEAINIAETAINAGNASTATITALMDYADNSTATISQNIVIDLAGHTITRGATITNNGTLDIYSSVDGGIITGSPDDLITNNGTFSTNGTSAEHTMSLINTTNKAKTRIINGEGASATSITLNSNSTLEFTNPIASDAENNRYIVSSSGIVTVNGATLKISENGTEKEFGIANMSTATNGRIIINDGTTIETAGYALWNNGGTSTGDTPAILVNGDNTVISGKIGIVNSSSGTITVNGGTISGRTNAIENAANGTINVTGGTITGGIHGIYNSNASNGTIYVSGENTSITGTTGIGIRGNMGNVTVTGGTITGSTQGIHINKVNSNAGTLTIGTNDGNVSKTSPEIISIATEGNNYGVFKANGTTFNFYDGKITGYTGHALKAAESAKPTGYQVVKRIADGKETAVLEKEVTVTFNPNPAGTTGATAEEASRKVLTNVEYQYDADAKTNRTLPLPTKTGYTFKEWQTADNLISTNPSDWQQGGIWDATGEDSERTTRIRTDYIKVSPNTKYKLNVNNSNNITIRDVWFYNNDKTFISRYGVLFEDNKEFTTPNDCYYIRTVLQYTDGELDILPSNVTDANIYLTKTVIDSTLVTLENNHTLTAVWEATPYTLVEMSDENIIFNGTFEDYTIVDNPGWDGALNGVEGDATKAYYSTGWQTGINKSLSNYAIGYHAHMKVVDGNAVFDYKTNEDIEGVATNRWLGIYENIDGNKLTAGKQYAITMDVYRVSGDSYITTGLAHATNTNSTTRDFYSGGKSALKPTKTGEWETLTCIFTLSSDYLSNEIGPRLYIYGNEGQKTGELYVDNIKLDEVTTYTKDYDTNYTSIELTEPTREDYTFGGWYSDKTYTKQISTSDKFDTTTANFQDVSTPETIAIIYPKWTQNTFQLHYFGNGGTNQANTNLLAKYDALYKGSNANQIQDLSLNEKPGTLSNVTTGADYLQFNGSNSYVNLGVINSEHQTLEATFSTDGITAGIQCIISNVEGGGGDIILSASSEIVGRFHINGAYRYVYTGIYAKPGKIYHVAATYDGNSIVVYVNGKKAVENNDSEIQGKTITPSTLVMVLGGNPGKNNAATADFFKGKIYNAAVYSEALTEEQVAKEAKKVTLNRAYGELPALTRAGYTFDGWYKEATFTNAVTTDTIYTTASDSGLYAKWTPRTDTAYTVNHYVHDIDAATYTLNSTDNLQGTSDASLTLANLKKTIAGYTYEEGFITGDTTKPDSGAVATTTIAADGSRVINLYYRPNYLYIQYHMNGGRMSEEHGSVYGTSGSLVTHINNATSTNFLRGVYGSKVGKVTIATYTVDNAGLHDYINANAMNIERTGYSGKTNAHWNTKADGTGTSYNQTYSSYKAVDMATACGKDLSTGDQVITLYVNWVPVTYSITYDLDSGTVATDNPTSYTIETNDITLNNPTKTGYTFTGWTEEISDLVWTKGFLNLSTGAHELNSTYPNSYYTNLFKLKAGVTYTLSGYGDYAVGDIKWRVYNTDGSYYKNVGSTNTYTAEKDCYVRIMFYNNPTAEQRSGAKITSSAMTTATIPQGSVANKKYTANYTANNYTVTANANGGTLGTTEGWSNNAGNTETTKTVTYDSAYGTLPTVERTGYTFRGWREENGKNLFDEESILMAINGAVHEDGYYVFAPEKAHQAYGGITSNPVGYIGNKQMNITYKENTQYTLTLRGHTNYVESAGRYPYLYYGFIYTDGTSTVQAITYDNDITRTMTSNANKTIQYISFSYGIQGGTAYISYIQLEEGTTATPYEPYYVTSSTPVTTASDHSINAIWEPFHASLGFNANGGSGAPTGTIMATYDEPMPTLTTTPTKSGYTFLGWYDTSASTGGNQYYYADGTSARNWDKTDFTCMLYARWK